MPNHVTNKIEFDCSNAPEIFAAICDGDEINFNKLIPMPPHVYLGGLSKEDEKDFPLNWLTWSHENWGTKWNAYSCSIGIENGKAFIKFDTAWSVPYPVIAAFSNKFQIEFEHRYFDEGHNFWGIENWAKGEHEIYGDRINRLSNRKSIDDDKIALCMELKGYVPTKDEESCAS